MDVINSNRAGFAALSEEEQRILVSGLAEIVVSRYLHGEVTLELINFEYNATFKVEDSKGDRYALRMNINSLRSEANLKAELAFISHLSDNSKVNTPHPVLTLDGGSSTKIRLVEADRDLHCVMYSWLEGQEFGDEPSVEQLFALGVAMANMHIASVGFTLPEGAELPTLDDFFWGSDDRLLSSSSELDERMQLSLKLAVNAISAAVGELYKSGTPIVIHADLHGWNVMWSEGELSVFDFDDCGLGLPIQDLSTALYYLDTQDQVQALQEGYQSVAQIPNCSEYAMRALNLHRRILLLNYLYETSNPEHREMRISYLEETLKRVDIFLESINAER